MSSTEQAPEVRLPIATAAQTRAAIARSLRGRWWSLAAATVLLIGSAAAGLVMPASLGAMVDADGQSRVVWLGIAMGAAAIAQGGLLALGLVIASRLTERLLADLRERMVSRALRLPHSTVERAGAGDLVSRATDDVAQIAEVAPRVVPAVGGAAFTILMTFFGMALLDWRFALAMLVIVPLHVLAMRWYLRTAPQVYQAERAANAQKTAQLLRAMQGIDTVRAYNLSSREEREIGAASWRVAVWSLRARIVQNRFFGRLNTAEFVGTAAILLVAYWLVSDGAVSVGMATTAVLFFLRLYDPIGQLLFVVDDLQSAAASLARIVGIDFAAGQHDAPERYRQREVASSGRPGDVVAGLWNVSFGYDPARPVLRDVSIRVGPAEHIALVGASGAGKSTVGALLAGLREPDSGSHAMEPDVFMISQEVHVFDGTLRENLLLAAPGASDEQLRAAFESVGAGGLVAAMPDGLDTQVGHQGHQVSAADAQLMALARVVLADPPFVILDEPSAEAGSAQSSALDAAVAAAIEGRAALVIVHRLTQAAEADRVVVMADGAITEQGTHDELRAAPTAYAAMWDAWQSNRSPGAGVPSV
ncbi:ABC transporter ATP-binding protein [Cumulibacter soli]|uniref:ABC transporter ATP-binding protein n=1 Tax=Cumulibacter soli TaxID=2546344 RepID=UPI0010680E0B|nr:ABC transporter ATP-binding protein [Cumulibacter soli]